MTTEINRILGSLMDPLTYRPQLLSCSRTLHSAVPSPDCTQRSGSSLTHLNSFKNSVSLSEVCFLFKSGPGPQLPHGVVRIRGEEENLGSVWPRAGTL